ncbi:MAG: iron ABC transporter permease, partial [Chloroflexales bacterium]|nr:iron ABC transporter permease [Chloroflexales bacterium]
RSTSAVARPRRPVALGRWRIAALGYCAAVTGLALGVPLLALLYWLLRGISNGQTLQPIWRAAGNSLLASGLAAGLALAAALPVALLAVRHPGRLSRLIERSTYIGYGLPGIVVALALVFFGAKYAPTLYQTMPMLLLAYLVRFLPEAVGSVRTALLQLNPHVEEAARSLGRRPLGALASVTAPLLRPGMLAGAALVFLTAMKELPATLLLGPTGFTTLATSIWGATAEAFFARAAAPALLLLLVSSLGLIVLLSQERTR